ncbi:MAG: prepilin-type N-terminal cleavage/methylation domain-containing protein [Planctomycetota bacterium]|nr:MAG: prepilin-type N-terminal cleavage/methylation domain-containing protein [Planctomycetota bacterium]
MTVRPMLHPLCRGFTLIETVVALAVSSVLLLALSSTVLLASRAVPSGNETVIAEAEIQRSLALMSSDIEVATAISTTSGLTLTVPDRDGDGNSDTIGYSWTDADNMVRRTRNGSGDEVLFGPITSMNVICLKDGTAVTQVLIVIKLNTVSGVTDRVLNVRALNLPG